MEIAKRCLRNTANNDAVYQPDFFRIGNASERSALEDLLRKNENIVVLDEIDGQLRELIKSLNPAVKISSEEYPALITAHLKGIPEQEYGVWVYYPWCNKVVHLLDEAEFVEVRTNRNRYKITRTEQDVLKDKKIGVVGLSVGQSIALTLAMERTCGELRLADFDTAELSNLNRIRTGVHNLGLKKTVIAAREIAEIDPYLKLKIFSDGLNSHNLDAFFTDGGKLDLLVEVCDGLDIKIVSRYKAKDLGIPVIMDTNDRGMLDVERFDLEPDRPVLHGLAAGLDPENIRGLTNEEKIPHILKMVGAETISTRLKASMIEVEQSINTWPQLASSVTLGGAITTDVCRRILLEQFRSSGRYYLDIEQIIGDPSTPVHRDNIPDGYLPPKALDHGHMLAAAEQYVSSEASESLPYDIIRQIVEAAIQAPSGGNCQPWKFLYHNSRLYIFHDLNLSYSFLDYNSYGAFVAMGAAIENIIIKSRQLGLSCMVDYVSEDNREALIAVASFVISDDGEEKEGLANVISLRHTNRNIGERVVLDKGFYNILSEQVSRYEPATLHIVDDPDEMRELGDILSTTEKFVLMHPRGHFDAFHKELKWPENEHDEIREGLDVRTLGISKGETSAMKIANNTSAIDFVRDVIKGGDAFKKISRRAVAAASALGIITMPEYSARNFLLGGRALERIWLESNSVDISFQPISQFSFLLARLVHGQGIDLDERYQQEFSILKERFYNLIPHLENRQPIFIFRLCKAHKPHISSLRKELDSVFIYQA